MLNTPYADNRLHDHNFVVLFQLRAFPISQVYHVIYVCGGIILNKGVWTMLPLFGFSEMWRGKGSLLIG